MTSGKSVALVQSRATDFPAVINVGYCPRVRAITNTKYKLNAEAMGSTLFRNRGGFVVTTERSEVDITRPMFLNRVDPIGHGV